MGPFPDAFQQDLDRLMRWRRDVRRFKTDPVEAALLARCLDAFRSAPSVGLSEPWRLLRLTSPDARNSARRNFAAANEAALRGYSGARAERYAQLKLSGLDAAPELLLVCCDEATEKGAGLGTATMPEMRRYSCVAAITQFWLRARAAGLGVGWVSILDPAALARDLDLPADWAVVALLCIGWPEADSDTPELEQAGWESRAAELPIETR